MEVQEYLFIIITLKTMYKSVLDADLPSTLLDTYVPIKNKEPYITSKVFQNILGHIYILRSTYLERYTAYELYLMITRKVQSHQFKRSTCTKNYPMARHSTVFENTRVLTGITTQGSPDRIFPQKHLKHS